MLLRTLTDSAINLLAPEVADVSNNLSVPAHVLLTSRTPGAGILQQFFDVTDVHELFQIDASQPGTILEIEVDVVLNVQPGRTTVFNSNNISIIPPTIGLCYWDLGNPPGSRILVPVASLNDPLWT